MFPVYDFDPVPEPAARTLLFGSPESLRRFLCGWLASERFGPEWKPSVSGIVISYVDPEVLLTVDPERAGRWREPPYFEDLVRFATDGNVVGIKTYLRIGPQIHEVLPLVAALAV
jgi:hypothetical protein